MIANCRASLSTVQAPPTFRCDGCCRRFPTADLRFVGRGTRLCGDCVEGDLQIHTSAGAIFLAAVRAAEHRRFAFARQLATWGVSELFRLNGVCEKDEPKDDFGQL